MELLLNLAVKFWQWTILIAVVIIGFIINMFDKKTEDLVSIKYKDFPTLKPVRIPTKGKGFWGGIITWLLSTRNWVLVEDWHYSMWGKDFVIPAGFKFDGASIPKFLRTFFSPVGVLLIGGLIHDYAYKYQTLLLKNYYLDLPTEVQKKWILFSEVFLKIIIQF